MPKHVLGRGLGNLLGDKPAGGNPASAPNSEPAKVRGGLGTLINGGRARDSANLANTPQQLDLTAAANTSPPESLANSPAQAPAPQTVPSPPRLWRWALLVADLFLVTLALLLVFKSPAPLKPWELALCALAVGLGALLACTALLGGRRQ